MPNIIDKAEYLYGTDIGSLEGRNITAHPAQGRAISLFESEYVLVCKVGMPAVSLHSLATVKFKNPFKGQSWDIAEKANKGSSRIKGTIEAEMGDREPEDIFDVKEMDPEYVARVVHYAKAVAQAANQHSVTIRDKDPIGPEDVQRIVKEMQNYITAINKLL